MYFTIFIFPLVDNSINEDLINHNDKNSECSETPKFPDCNSSFARKYDLNKFLEIHELEGLSYFRSSVCAGVLNSNEFGGYSSDADVDTKVEKRQQRNELLSSQKSVEWAHYKRIDKETEVCTEIYE